MKNTRTHPASDKNWRQHRCASTELVHSQVVLFIHDAWASGGVKDRRGTIDNKGLPIASDVRITEKAVLDYLYLRSNLRLHKDMLSLRRMQTCLLNSVDGN